MRILVITAPDKKPEVYDLVEGKKEAGQEARQFFFSNAVNEQENSGLDEKNTWWNGFRQCGQIAHTDGYVTTFEVANACMPA